MPYTQLNNLDFTDIKNTLKEYMRAQTDFIDYDFEGSAISQILDVLAYNTYYTAFNTNMVVNELFLDSATLRDNVVSLAKQLGYTPKSITAPKASVSMALTFSGTAPAEVAIKAGSGFVTNYDGSLYRYVLKENMRVLNLLWEKEFIVFLSGYINQKIKKRLLILIEYANSMIKIGLITGIQIFLL